jgi:hypothetical protein
MKVEQSKHPDYFHIVDYLLEHDTHRNLAKNSDFKKNMAIEKRKEKIHQVSKIRQ